jgi:hypothetical protein
VPLYYTGAVKWTSIVTNRLLLEAGWGATGQGINSLYQPGVLKERGTPEWYANASRFDLVLNTRTTASTPATSNYPYGKVVQAGASYVTGSHNVKAGLQWRYGVEMRTTESNADLVQQYRNRVPDSVIVYNTPSGAGFALNADTGIYAQDSWKIRRFTVTPGVRLEYFTASIEANEVMPGRFVGYRSIGRMTDLPEWFDVAPRLGITYDLWGDARTAIKGSVNKYYAQQTTGFPARYSQMTLQSDTRNWSDCDSTPGTSTCSGRVLPTNGDDIAQDNEIGPSNNRLFGLAPARHPAANIKRPYTIEYSLGADHELLRGLAVGFIWYRRSWGDLESQINTLLDPATDYTAFRTANPLTGEALTIYNLNRAKQGLVDLLDTTSTDRSRTSQVYNGFEASFSLRLPNAGSVFGGVATNRTVTIACENADPNKLRNCDQTLFRIPFRTDMKIAGTYLLPWHLQIGAAFQSYAGAPLAVNWAVPASVFPNGQRTQSVTVNLIEPGTAYLKRWNQLDINVKRNFELRKVRYDIGVDLFNVLNENVVLSQNQNFGAILGRPQEILQPIMARVSANLKF